MTTQDFRRIAEIIRGMHSLEKLALAREFSEWFAEVDPRFDRKRFMVACGLHPNT